MYRLNCNLPDELADRLDAYSKKTGVAKVNAVILALNNYLDEQEHRAILLQQMSDPNVMALMLQNLELSPDKSAELMKLFKG